MAEVDKDLAVVGGEACSGGPVAVSTVDVKYVPLASLARTPIAQDVAQTAGMNPAHDPVFVTAALGRGPGGRTEAPPLDVWLPIHLNGPIVTDSVGDVSAVPAWFAALPEAAP